MRNSPVMHLCSGVTIRENETILGMAGWVMTEVWVAIADDLSVGQLRHVLRVLGEMMDTWDWTIELASIDETDDVAKRFARFMGFREFDRPKPGVVRYERVQR